MIITVPVEFVKNYFAGTVRNIRVIFIKKAKKVVDRDKTGVIIYKGRQN
jgi:hypothetical protein